MASRGECAARGASAASSVVSALDSGSMSAAAIAESGAGAGCAPADRRRATTSSPSASLRAGRLTVTCSHLPRRRRASRGSAERGRKSAGIESQETDAARSDRALGGVDPAYRRRRRQRVEIVHDHDEPIRRRSRRGRLSDPGAERGEELARRARRRVARFQKFRPRGPHGRHASGALARGFGALGGRVRFGGQRRHALIEASGAGLEILAPFPGLLGQQPGAAQQEGSRTQARATG